MISTTMMGIVYSRFPVLRCDDAGLFPYLAAGLALWSLIASFANDALAIVCRGGRSEAHQTPLPFSGSTFCARVANMVIQFLHVGFCSGSRPWLSGGLLQPADAARDSGNRDARRIRLLADAGVGTQCLRWSRFGAGGAMTVVTQLFFLLTLIGSCRIDQSP